MPVERSRDIAHVSAVQLRTEVPEQTVDFFVRLLGLSEVAREDGTCYVRTWDDYERFTVAVVEADQPGIGITWLRAAGPEALARRVKIIEASGYGIGWTDGPQGIGPTYLFRDPDGHELGIYWESEWYEPPEGGRPALKNQAAPFPGRGANVRRLDHVNYLAADIGAIARFMPEVVGARLTEQIVLDDGSSVRGLVPRLRQGLRPRLHQRLDRQQRPAASPRAGDGYPRGHPAGRRRDAGGAASTSRPDRTSTRSSRRSSSTSGSRAATGSNSATPVPGWSWPRTGSRSRGRSPSAPRARPGA